MKEDFFQFIIEPSKEAFLKAREEVVNHKDYNPYLPLLEDLGDLLEKKEFAKVVEFKDINLMLSPRAHSHKRYAYLELGMEKEAEFEIIFARRILECILLTGDGTKEAPYLVTRVQDERDVLSFIGEKYKMQALINEGDRSYDRINTESGKTIFFDITDCYKTLSKVDPEEFLDRILGDEEEEGAEAPQKETSFREMKQKPWWKFWA